MSTYRRLAVDHLKRCPLCEAINSKVSSECFVCSWSGEFDHDALSIEEGLTDMLDQCPELIDTILIVPPRAPSRVAKAKFWLRRLFGSAIDFRV